MPVVDTLRPCKAQHRLFSAWPQRPSVLKESSDKEILDFQLRSGATYAVVVPVCVAIRSPFCEPTMVRVGACRSSGQTVLQRRLLAGLAVAAAGGESSALEL